MGTSSSGGSGSGSGLRAASRGLGGGNYSSNRGRMINKSINKKGLNKEITEVFKGLFTHASKYIKEMFGNKYVIDIYSELFYFSSLLKEEDTIQQIANRYTFNMDENGFIINLINKIHEIHSSFDGDFRCVEAARTTLEKFLFKSVDDDPHLSVDASGREVVKFMKENTSFWKSISGYFLSYLVFMIYRKEMETKSLAATYAVQQEITKRTNQVIKDYEKLFGTNQVIYTDLLKYISENWAWFIGEMT